VAYLTWRRGSERGERQQFQEGLKEEKKPEAPDLISELEKEIAKKREEANKS